MALVGERKEVDRGVRAPGLFGQKKDDPKGKKRKIAGVGKIRKNELCPFTQKLAAMLGSGLPLLQCIEALADQTENPEFKRCIEGIHAKVEGGDTFTDALNGYVEVFGDLYISMVSAGEMSGALSKVMQRLAIYMESSQALRRKVKSAMMYPTVVMCIALLLTSAMVIFIVPTFAGIFDGFDAKLPAPTLMLVSISDFARDYWYIIGGAIFVVVYGFKAWKKSKSGAYTFDKLSLRIPSIGKLVEKVALARCCRTFSSLLESGLPVLQCIDIVGQTSGNKFIEQGIMAAKADVEGGQTLTDAFSKTELFPSMLLHMLAAGEQTGNVENMLGKVADFYEDEVNVMLDGLSSMIEPILMVFIGTVVGGIVICMFLPIFKMAEIVQ